MALTRREKILPGSQIKNKLPINLIAEEKFLFENELVKDLPTVDLNYFSNVSVTPHGILFNGFHIYKEFLIWEKHSKEFNLFYLIRNYLKRKKKIADENSKYIICFDYWSMGYFHWMCDLLPRLILLEDHLKDHVLLLPANHYDYPYVEQSLKIFDIRSVLKFSDSEYVQCHSALVPDYLTVSGDNHPVIMNKLKAKLINYFKPKEDVSYAQNIYVSRAKAKGRFITNEKEVSTALTALGFKIVYFEDHSFVEQINLAFNCKNLIGLHGANLVNILFMKPQSNVLELRTQNDDRKNYYFSLASTFDLNYFYLQCSPTNMKNPESLDFTVDITALKEQVIRMLNH